MRNVAYLIDTMESDTAGTQRQLLETIGRLDRDRWRPRLVCLWESPWMRTAELPCPVDVLGYEGFVKPSLPGAVGRLRSLLGTHGIDVLQTFFEDSLFVAWLATRGLRDGPVLLSSRRDMGLGAGNQPWYHRLFPFVLPLVNLGFDGIVANSETVRDYVARRERTSAGRIAVLRNGVEMPAAEPRFRRPPRTVDEPVRVAVVASLTPVKRHDLVLAALAEPALDPRLRVVFYGDGPLRGELEARAAELRVTDRVEFAGAVDDVPARLPEFDIGLLCSDREGLSNAILECMAGGLPVVATEVGGNPELVDEACGRLVPRGDAAALSAALNALSADDSARLELGRAAYERVRRDFSWEASLAALTAYYDAFFA